MSKGKQIRGASIQQLPTVDAAERGSRGTDREHTFRAAPGDFAQEKAKLGRNRVKENHPWPGALSIIRRRFNHCARQRFQDGAFYK